jgi:hypothetical protein
MQLHHIAPDHAVAHVASLGTLLAAWQGWLPHFAAVIPAVYYAVLLWETKTVQGWVHRRQRHGHHKQNK